MGLFRAAPSKAQDHAHLYTVLKKRMDLGADDDAQR